MIAYTYLRLPLINLPRPWTASAWFDMVSTNEWDLELKCQELKTYI